MRFKYHTREMVVTGGDLKEPVTLRWQLRNGHWIVVKESDQQLHFEITSSYGGWGNTVPGFRRMCRHLNLKWKWLPKPTDGTSQPVVKLEPGSPPKCHAAQAGRPLDNQQTKRWLEQRYATDRPVT